MTAYETTTTRLMQQELGACALIQDLLPLYLEGEVNTTSRDLIVEHLARCERCAGFLAGAQTTRVQLRRDAVQRIEVVQRDASAQRVLSAGQRMIQLVAAFLIYVVGTMCVVLTVRAMESESIFPIAGLFIDLACAFTLCAVAYPTIGTRMLRWIMLIVCGGTGALAAGMFTVLTRYGNPLPALMMLCLGMMSFIGIAFAMQWRVHTRL